MTEEYSIEPAGPQKVATIYWVRINFVSEIGRTEVLAGIGANCLEDKYQEGSIGDKWTEWTSEVVKEWSDREDKYNKEENFHVEANEGTEEKVRTLLLRECRAGN